MLLIASVDLPLDSQLGLLHISCHIPFCQKSQTISVSSFCAWRRFQREEISFLVQPPKLPSFQLVDVLLGRVQLLFFSLFIFYTSIN